MGNPRLTTFAQLADRKVFVARNRIKHALSIPVGFRLIGRRPDDQFIAAFPRSGSTWLRTMLVNIIEPTAHSNPDVFNRVIPAVSIRNTPLVRARVSPRIMMTHSVWRKQIPRVVYLVRDGRDALVSLYHYAIIRAGRQDSFETFFALYQREVFGSRWDDNVRSWLEGPGRSLGKDLLLVKFEELKAETDGVLATVVDFLGLDASRELRDRAIQEADLRNMRRIEKSRRGSFEAGQAFYRAGATGGWREFLRAELLNEFLQHGGARALHVAGYEA